MQRYQPPHRRGTRDLDGAPKQPASAPSLVPLRPQPSRRDWSTTPTPPALASPSSDLRPSRRTFTPPSVTDEMELLASVSRSGGEGGQGDALKDFSIQERFRDYITRRVQKHDALDAAGRSSTDSAESLASIVLLFRKLREGVVSSGRIDEFALAGYQAHQETVFQDSVTHAIRARNAPQLLSALSGLVPGLYEAVDRKGKGRAREVVVIVKRDDTDVAAVDQRAIYASLYVLYHLVHSTRVAYAALLEDLTLATRRSQRHTPFIPPATLWYARAAARSLAQESFNPLTYARLVADPRVSVSERAMLAWAADSVRERAGQVLCRAYMSTSVKWGAKFLALDDSDAGAVVTWATAKGLRIDNDMIRLR